MSEVNCSLVYTHNWIMLESPGTDPNSGSAQPQNRELVVTYAKNWCERLDKRGSVGTQNKI